MVDAAEYKRRQYPPGPKITTRNFGRDRRVPITNAWKEPLPPELRQPALRPRRAARTRRWNPVRDAA